MSQGEFVANGSGFGINFSNGYRLAVRWGPDCQCEHENDHVAKVGTKDYFRAYRASSDAQIAVMNSNGQPVKLHDEHNPLVMGYVPVTIVAQLISVIDKALNDKEIAIGMRKIISKRNIFNELTERWNETTSEICRIPAGIEQDRGVLRCTPRRSRNLFGFLSAKYN
jgi:hypothetical protein